MTTGSKLRRGLSQRQLNMIAIGGVIGAGLFVGSGVVVGEIGPAAFITYALTGALIVLIMRMLGEMAAAHPSTGSFADYARHALGGWAGFSVGWLYWYFWVIVVGFEAVAGGKVISYWIDAPLWLLSLIPMLAMTATNLFSVASFGEFEFWFAGIKVAVIAVFLGLGSLFVLGLWPHHSMDFSNLTAHGGFLPHGVGIIFSAISVVIGAMVGAEVATIAAAETVDPERAVRRATRSVVVRILIFYVGSVFLLAAVVPWNALGASPFAAALTRMGVPAAAHIVNAVVLTAVLSCLNSGLYTASRMLFVLAARHEAPAQLVKVSPRGVPAIAVICSSVVGFLCVIMAWVSPGTVFVFLLNSSGAVVLFVYALIAISQIVLRRRTPPVQLQVKMWCYPALSIIALAGMTAVLVLMAFDHAARTQLWLSLLCWAVALALYFVPRWSWRSPARRSRAQRVATGWSWRSPARRSRAQRVATGWSWRSSARRSRAQRVATRLSSRGPAKPTVEAQTTGKAKRVLVLADEDLTAKQLFEVVRRVDTQRRAEYFICVPANPLDTGQAENTGPVYLRDATAEAAHHRLDTMVTAMRNVGLHTEGEIGDERPAHALADAVEHFRPDQLVIVEDPSTWHHLAQRARSAYAIPVIQVLSESTPTRSW